MTPKLVVVGVALILVGCAPSPSDTVTRSEIVSGTLAQSSNDRFDGKWRLSLTYSRAASSDPRCSGHLLPDPMTISNGKLSGVLNHNRRGTCFMRGAVKANGELEDAACDSARAFFLEGRIDQNAGKGTWLEPETDTCDGLWTATKIE